MPSMAANDNWKPASNIESGASRLNINAVVSSTLPLDPFSKALLLMLYTVIIIAARITELLEPDIIAYNISTVQHNEGCIHLALKNFNGYNA